MFTVYVLKSDVDGRLYKGFTQDIEVRIMQHNSGKTKSTKGFRPWRLVYSELHSTQKEAIDREKFFKSGQGRDFLKTVIK